jgi:hypothetical protein
MARVLPDETSLVKHVILLTDGGADPSGIPELVGGLYNEHGITLSSVGVGRDAAPFLEQLAGLGGGRYHFTADPGSIPSIFTEETTLATRSYIVEEPFTPELVNSSPILSGIDAVPQLHGYVGTSPKEVAQTILVSPGGDPLLAAWQYGLGKAVAFTSDATGRWAKDWLTWQGFPRFWAQAVRFTISPRSQSPLEIRVEQSGETARLTVDAYRYAGEAPENSESYLNGYDMQARIVAPDGEVTEVELRQTAPGRYEGEFIPGEQGAYLIRVSASPAAGAAPAGNESVAETAGWVLSYSPEYRQLDSDPDTLARIAAAAGGAIAPQDPGGIFTHNRVAPSAPRPAWPWLLALAALLLPIDIAVRRLVIGWGDLRRGWEQVAARLAPRVVPAPQPPAREARLDALLQAKERAREVPPAQPPAARKPVASPEPARREEPGPIEKPAEPPPADRPAEESAPRSSTASTLLEQKRRRQGRKDQS